jgi:hypothetical protein
VPQRHGLPHDDVAIAVVSVVVEVGAAETSAADADLEFCWGGREDGAGFLGGVLVDYCCCRVGS